MLIASPVGVDLVTLLVLARAVFGPSFAPFWGLLVLFMMRQVSQVGVVAGLAAAIAVGLLL